MTKVLLVEDNAKMRGIIRNLIRDLAEIYECSDGETASSVYFQYQPDWVLMDIQLGKMSGIQAAREIIAADPGARVLIVTTYSDEELREAASWAGACGYVLKEDLSEIRRIIFKE